VIVDVTHSSEPSYRVFLNGRSEPFYEGQVIAAELDSSPALVDANAFRCKLAALSLMSPSGGSALSFNEGRIDHIQAEIVANLGSPNRRRSNFPSALRSGNSRSGRFKGDRQHGVSSCCPDSGKRSVDESGNDAHLQHCRFEFPARRTKLSFCRCDRV
jgi:hypothetical protein